METRLAMVEQMEQTAAIIRRAANSVYDMKRVEGLKRYQIDAGMRTHGLQVQEAWILEKGENWFELYLTLRTSRKSRCIPVKEAAWWPVSYTHLDVYKRQVRGRTQRAFPATDLSGKILEAC